MSYFLIIEAYDGYKVVFSLPEIDRAFNHKVVILADRENGQFLPDSKGRWQLIVPGDGKHARWVRQVKAIKIKSSG